MMYVHTMRWADVEARVEVEEDGLVSVIFEATEEGDSPSLDRNNFEEFVKFYNTHVDA